MSIYYIMGCYEFFFKALCPKQGVGFFCGVSAQGDTEDDALIRARETLDQAANDKHLSISMSIDLDRRKADPGVKAGVVSGFALWKLAPTDYQELESADRIQEHRAGDSPN